MSSEEESKLALPEYRLSRRRFLRASLAMAGSIFFFGSGHPNSARAQEVSGQDAVAANPAREAGTGISPLELSELELTRDLSDEEISQYFASFLKAKLGETSRVEVESFNGKSDAQPNPIDLGNGQKAYLFTSSDLHRDIYVITAPDPSGSGKELVVYKSAPGHRPGVSLRPAASPFLKRFGEPEIDREILGYGSDSFHQYAYPTKGAQFIVDTYEGTLFELGEFIPVSVEDFNNSWKKLFDDSTHPGEG